MVDVAEKASPETTEAVDFEAFVTADVGALTDGELVESLLVAQQMRARLDAAAIALVDRFDARTVWAADGDRSAAGWVSARSGIAFGQAKSECRIARDLRRHGLITAAARAGRLSTAQVKALLGARRPGLEEAFDLCEEILINEVARSTLAAGHRFLARWVQSTRKLLGVNEPDGTEPEGGEGRSTVRLSPVGDRWAGDMDLSAEDGEIIANAVAAQIDALWRAKVFTTDDGLTPGERRADALVELIRRGALAGPDDGTATPLILALTSAANLARPPADGASGPETPTPTEPAPSDTPANGAHSPAPGDDEVDPSAPDGNLGAAAVGSAQPSPETREPSSAPPPWPLPPAQADGEAAADADPLADLDPMTPFPRALAELSRTGPVSPDVMSRLACEGTVIPVYVGEGSEVLAMGRKIRIANKAQRQALYVRDGGCQFPGCHVAPEYCIAHHLIWWEHGGGTDLVNLLLLCRHHHRLIHKLAFTMTRGTDGTIVTTRPRGDPLTPHLRARSPLLRPAPPPDPDLDDGEMTFREAEYIVRCRITDLIRDAENRRRCRARPSETPILRC